MYLIADNLRITRPVIARALAEHDPGPVAKLARSIEAAGARAIDINTGPLARNPGPSMEFFVNAVIGATGLDIFLDTVNPVAMEAGLKAAANTRAAINGVSLEPARLDAMPALAVRYGADLVAFLLDEKSRVAPDADSRLSLAVELVEELAARGVEKSRIIVDPLCVPLSWPDGPGQARELVRFVRHLPEVLGYDARVMVGLSNLTTGPGPAEKKSIMQQVFLAMLAGAGTGAFLLDALEPGLMAAARAAGALAPGRVFTWEEL